MISLNYTQQVALCIAYFAFVLHDGAYSIHRTHKFFMLSLREFLRMQRTHLIQLRVIITYITIGLPLMLRTKLFPNTIYENWYYLAKAMLWAFGMKVDVIGEIPKDGTFVVVANHTSFFDIFLFGLIFKGKVGTVFLHKKLMNIPILGWWIKKLDVIPVVPPTARYESATASDVKKKRTFSEIISNYFLPKFVITEEEMRKVNTASIRRAMKVLSSGKSLIGLPEGTRTLNGQMGVFQEGLPAIAKKSGVPILTVSFYGSFEAKPKNRQWIKPMRITVRISKNPIDGTDLSTTEFTQKIKNSVQELLDQKSA